MYYPTIEVLLLSIFANWVHGKVEPNDHGGGSISFGQDFNDEFDHSLHMPEGLKCDACRAIAYQLTITFKKWHAKRPSVSEFSESDVIQITDLVCDQEWKGYGTKYMDNVKRLSGEGLETESMAGVKQAGGKVPERLKEMCYMYMGDLGEMTIYRQLLEGDLENYLCNGEGQRGYCSEARDDDGQSKNRDRPGRDDF